MKPIKPKICKCCGKEFIPYTSLVKYCSYKCENKMAKEKDKIKKVKIKEKKKVSISTLSKVADKLASEYTRKRDCLLTTGSLTEGICITCGEKKEYSQFDCGHFITRANKSTRWEEKNMNLQCKVCNCWGGGRQYEHGIAIDKKYGEGTAKKLLDKSKQIQKVTSEFLQNIIEYYKEKLDKLEK